VPRALLAARRSAPASDRVVEGEGGLADCDHVGGDGVDDVGDGAEALQQGDVLGVQVRNSGVHQGRPPPLSNA
jgi:hypothetical protein